MSTIGNHESGKVARFVEKHYTPDLKKSFENLLKNNENARQLNADYAQKPVTELYHRAVELSKKIAGTGYNRTDLVTYCACLNNIQAKLLILMGGSTLEKPLLTIDKENILPNDEDFKDAVSL